MALVNVNAKEFLRKFSAIWASGLKNFCQPCPRPKNLRKISFEGRPHVPRRPWVCVGQASRQLHDAQPSEVHTGFLVGALPVGQALIWTDASVCTSQRHFVTASYSVVIRGRTTGPLQAAI